MVDARGSASQGQPNSSGGGGLQPLPQSSTPSAWAGGPPSTQGSRPGRGGRGSGGFGGGSGRGGGRSGGGKPQPQQGYSSQRSQASSQQQRPVAEAVTVADFGANFGGAYELAAHIPHTQGQGPQHSRYGLDRTEKAPARPQQDAPQGRPRPDLGGAAAANGGPTAHWVSVSEDATPQQPRTHDPVNAAGNNQSVEARLASVKAEMGRLAAVEADLQRQLDEQSEVIKLKAEIAAYVTEISDLKEERASLRSNLENERRSFVAQIQEKDAELEQLKREAWGKDEAIRERDVQLMEVSKKQSDSDSNIAAAMEEINSAQARLSSREEELEKAASVKEKEYKDREAELLSAINEWQRMDRSKEEAIWHMQAAHANEKSNIEAHFMHQINHILAEKHALAEEVAQLKGGSSDSAAVRVSTPPVIMPVVMPPVTGAPMPGPQPPAAPQQQQPEGSGLNWIESLMNGTAQKQQQQQKPSSSHPPANAWGKEEGQAHHPSLDPRVPRPNTGHHAGYMPQQNTALSDSSSAVRLLTDHELVAVMKRVIPSGQEAARPWSAEDEMHFEDMLAPFNWADHYGPQHGSVMDFLLSNQDVFGMLPDGSVYCHHPTAPAANPMVQQPYPKKTQPVFGTVSPGGIPSPVGTPAARAASATGPTASGRPTASAVVVTPMPSITNTGAKSEARTTAPVVANSTPGSASRPPKAVIQTVATGGQHVGSRAQGGSSKTVASAESKGRPDSRSRSRRGGQGRHKDK